jgi:dihydroxyacetone kinase-like protein
MADQLESSRLSRMLCAATERIRAEHEMLSRLDGAVGDGDHGTTILRTMEAAAQAAAAAPESGLQKTLSSVAWAVMGCDGGSTGPLLGSFFLGMSEAAGSESALDAAGVVRLFEAGLARLQKQSRAQPGDKTLMDALLPAVAAMKTAPPGTSIQGLLQLAAAAAASGAESTRNLRAKFGRARNLGDRVLGHLDPGAVSMALLFQGFAEGA